MFQWSVPNSLRGHPEAEPRDQTLVAAWLIGVAGLCALLVLALHQIFVMTPRGQLVDSAALQGAQIGRQRIIDPVRQILDVVSVGSLAAAGLLAGAVALLRKRWLLAAVVLVTVVGSNVTTQLLKYQLFTRPDFGFATQGASYNTLPSGHTTVAMSVAVAAVLVSPARLRGVVSVAAATYAAATGVATLSAGYHRPSDAVAACLVVGAWAAALCALIVLVSAPPTAEPSMGNRSYPYVALLLGGAGAVLLAAGGLGTYVTAKAVPVDGDRARLLLAYGAGGALIAGTALAVLAALLVVVHRVVPPLPERLPAPSPLSYPGPASEDRFGGRHAGLG